MDKYRNMKVSQGKRKNGLLWLLFASCVIIGFIFAGCNKPQEKIKEELPNIRIEKPIIMDVEVTESYPATIESEDQADVVARVNGVILGKHFNEGDFVKKGQKLYTIEARNYAASSREAMASLSSAKASLDYAQHNYEALKKAYASNAVSEMEMLQALSQRDAARSDVELAETRLQTANTQLGYCTVIAPVSGKISSSSLDVGNYVNGEGSPVTLATIYGVDNLNIQFNISDNRYSEIAGPSGRLEGEEYKKVRFSIGNEYSGSRDGEKHSYSVDITYESPFVDVTTGNLNIKGKLNDADEIIRPGMYGIINLPIAEVKNGILVRDASISTNQRGKFLYTVNKNNEIVYTPIEIGELYNDTLRLVKSGLKGNEPYVRDAMITVRAGEKINPVESKNGK